MYVYVFVCVCVCANIFGMLCDKYLIITVICNNNSIEFSTTRTSAVHISWTSSSWLPATARVLWAQWFDVWMEIEWNIAQFENAKKIWSEWWCRKIRFSLIFMRCSFISLKMVRSSSHSTPLTPAPTRQRLSFYHWAKWNCNVLQ